MFSSRGIAGTEETDNRGLADPILLFKQECLGFVLGRLPFNSGFSDGCWLRLARVHLADYNSHNLAPHKLVNRLFGSPHELDKCLCGPPVALRGVL